MRTLRAIVACLMAFTIVFSAVSIVGRTELFSGVKNTVTEGVNNIAETFGDMTNADLENLIQQTNKEKDKLSVEPLGSVSMEKDNLADLLIEQLTESKTDNSSINTDALLENLDSDGSLKVPFDEIYPEAISEGIVEFDETTLLVKKSKVNRGISFEMIWAGVAKLETIFEMENDIWYTAKLIKGVDVAKTVEKLRALDEVEAVDYNYEMKTTAMAQAKEPPQEMAGNEKINDQWYMEYCGIAEGYTALGDKKGGSSDVIVAVIDTGVDIDHEDLINNIWVNNDETPNNGVDDDENGYIDDYYGVNIVDRIGNGDDDNGHGTHVAGIIGAENNGIGTVGLAYNTKIMPVKAANSSGNFLQSDIAKAIIYAYENGAEVINMSFGGVACSAAVQEALKAAHNRCVLVASAGNDGKANEGDKEAFVLPNYPAALDYVLGVMSVGKQGIESLFTNFDAFEKSLIGYDIYAPGESIVSTIPNNKYASWSGTSMASPMVAAMAALLRAHFSDREKYTPEYIYGQLISSTEDKANCCNPEEHGEHFVPDIVNLGNAITKETKPEIIVTDYSLFDTIGLENDTDGVNNGDSAVDVGETLALGLELKNKWGAAKAVTVTVDCNSEAGIPDPYIEILTATANYGGIGTYSKTDAGKIFTDDLFTGWEKPLYIRVAENCPNNYVFNVNVTITSKNDVNLGDETVYETKDTLSFTVRNGVVLPSLIENDMTLTKNNLYIIPKGVLIPSGVTVNVEPGTNIQFWSSDPDYPYTEDDGEAKLVVDGTLNLVGTEAEPIKIFPSELKSDEDVYISNATNISYVEVINPYIPKSRSISNSTFYNGTVTSSGDIKNCVFYDNSANGKIIDNCKFYDLNSGLSADAIMHCEFFEGNLGVLRTNKLLENVFLNLTLIGSSYGEIINNAFLNCCFSTNISTADIVENNLFLGNSCNDNSSRLSFNKYQILEMNFIPSGRFVTHLVETEKEVTNAAGKPTGETEIVLEEQLLEKGVFIYEKGRQDVIKPFVEYLLQPDVLGGSLKIETETDLLYYKEAVFNETAYSGFATITVIQESAIQNYPIDFELIYNNSLNEYTWSDGTELGDFLKVEGVTDTYSEYSPIFYNGEFVSGESYAESTKYSAVQVNCICAPKSTEYRKLFEVEIPQELAGVLNSNQFIEGFLLDSSDYDMKNINRIYTEYFEENPISLFKNNSIINPISSVTDTSKWLRIFAPKTGVQTTHKIGSNYWGTTNEEVIGLQIVDGNDNIDYARIDAKPYLSKAPETTYPFVTDVTVLDKTGAEATSVGAEEITVKVEFNRDMDTSIPLNVAFGNLNDESTLQNVYKLTGEYVDEKTWVGTYTIGPKVESGYHYFVIDNGCAKDTKYKLYCDVGRFSFKVDTTAAQSMLMQGEATDTGIKLTWEQDDFDTLVGYNVYRSTSEEGFYQKINDVMIPADEFEFFDDGVEPGQIYYYNFTVVKSDLNESEPSGKVVIQAKDTMAPNIYHSTPGTAFMGENLILSATITDNLAVQTAKIYYRTIGDTEWKVSVLNKLNDKYSSIIQSTEITTAGLEYYIEAFDGVSYTYKGNQSNPYTIEVREAVPTSSKGDVDGDGVVTNVDALLVLKQINNQIVLDASQFARADIDGSGTLTPEDALRILHYVSGASSSLTA